MTSPAREGPSPQGQRGRRVFALVIGVGVIYAVLMGILVFTRSSGPIAAPPEAVVYAVGNLGDPESAAPAVAGMLQKHQFAALLALGNLAPPDGSPNAYQHSYRPTFETFDDRVRPAPGELDRGTSSGYDGYFSARAPGYKGSAYYFFTLAGWRIFSLDSKAAATPDSPMYIWLRDSLAEANEGCVAAFWHTSGTDAAAPVSDGSPMRYVWDLLAAYHADVVLTADADLYRRYEVRDGISAFVVGTGGTAAPAPSASPAEEPKGSEVTAHANGALELNLRAGGADFAFRRTDDQSLDSGSINCHGRQPAPGGRPATPASLTSKPGAAGVALTWTAGKGGNPALGYLVLRGGDRIGFTTKTSFVDSTLPKGASVLYTVRSIDRAGAVSVESASVHSGGKTPGYTDYTWATVESNPASPTADKPQSKLWWNAGSWWGLLWATDPRNKNHQAYFIQQFDAATQAWTNTGVAADDRQRSHPDVLWDPETSNLYVASTLGSGGAKLFRFSFAKGAYAADDGFPIRLTDAGSESITIVKDSKGILWATVSQLADGSGPCVKSQACWVRTMHSTTADWRWTAPVAVPLPEANVLYDDISTVVAFGGKAIGVAWSNQLNGGVYFAVHADSAPDSAWRLETVSLRPRGADDHLNIKADSAGRVYLITKTSLNAITRTEPTIDPKDPLIMLWIRQPSGTWAGSTAWTVGDDATRPQVVVDEAAGLVYAFASVPGTGGAIYVKTALIRAPVFDTRLGSVLMAVGEINNPTTTKQTVRLSDGILVLAGDTVSHTYWHAYLTPRTNLAP
jgi:hypothetical protein